MDPFDVDSLFVVELTKGVKSSETLGVVEVNSVENEGAGVTGADCEKKSMEIWGFRKVSGLLDPDGIGVAGVVAGKALKLLLRLVGWRLGVLKASKLLEDWKGAQRSGWFVFEVDFEEGGASTVSSTSSPESLNKGSSDGLCHLLYSYLLLIQDTN